MFHIAATWTLFHYGWSSLLTLSLNSVDTPDSSPHPCTTFRSPMNLPLLGLSAVRRTRHLALLVVALLAATASFAQGAGYWHTRGNQILDANDKQVRIAGINWYGLETTSQVPSGLQSQDYRTILNTIKATGFNTVRIPFSSQMIETPASSLNVSYSNSSGIINADLAGLNSLQVLDRIVTYAGSIGLRVILDHHRSEAGSSAEANGLWYTAQYSEASWIADWVVLAKRYLGNSTVIGFDLDNEPHSVNTGGGACWDCGGASDWHLAAERGGNAVLAVNPSLLVFVEGTDVYGGVYTFWGADLEGVQKSPVVLTVSNQLVYSPHDYGPLVFPQAWFNPTTTYSSLTSLWIRQWAYISQKNIAPIWVGEFGTGNLSTDILNEVSGSEGQWFQSIIQFLGTQPSLSWSYWAVNGEDALSLLDSNYDAQPVSQLKQQFLASIQFPLAGDTPPPAVPTGLTATAISTSQIALKWNAVLAAGIKYNVYVGTATGKTTTLSNGGVIPASYTVANLGCCTPYFFTVKAVSTTGAESAASNEAMAVTLNPPTPMAPALLTATATGPAAINLAWKASSTLGVSYTVFMGNSANTIHEVAGSALGGTSLTLTNLTPATSYFFTVKAVLQTALSSVSNTANATTKAAVAPAPATALTGKEVSSTEVDLTWQPSTTPNVTYNVYVSPSAGLPGTLLAGKLSHAAYQAKALQPGTTYYFTVVAVAYNLGSPVSNTVAVKTPSIAPSSCHVTYTNSPDWGSGFISDISITNTGTTPIKSWTLTWSYTGNQMITQGWRAVVAQTGKNVSLTSFSYDGVIAPGTSVGGIGFQATYSGKNVAPAAFALNGSVCK